MTINNNLLNHLSQVGIRHKASAYYPDYLVFAGEDNTINGDETKFNDEYYRKAITWTNNGIGSNLMSEELTTAEGNGNIINILGASNTLELETGVPLFATVSDIGSKDTTFAVDIRGEIIIRRPR